MRWLVLFALALSPFLARDAAAAEAPSAGAEAGVGESEPATPRGPIEEPEDWIAVAGIVCYSVLPLMAIAAVAYLTYRFFLNEADAALLPWQRSDWLFRGAASASARPPPGLVLLRF